MLGVGENTGSIPHITRNADVEVARASPWDRSDRDGFMSSEGETCSQRVEGAGEKGATRVTL